MQLLTEILFARNPDPGYITPDFIEFTAKAIVDELHANSGLDDNAISKLNPDGVIKEILLGHLLLASEETPQ